MAPEGLNSDLPTLVRRLAKEGPLRTLRTPRRVRAFVDGACIVDTLGTTGALFVWEHPYYPQYYFPRQALTEKSQGYQVVYEERDPINDDENQRLATLVDIQIRRRENLAKDAADGRPGDSGEIKDSLVVFHDELGGKSEELRGLVKLRFEAADQWFEEDTPMFDTLSSNRGLRISIEGHTLTETSASVHLYETSLPVRYYIPRTSIDASVLRPSKTRTRCPYKGEAEYCDVHIGDKVFKDIVWFYTRPTVECAAIAGFCCFYNEKVDASIQVGDTWETTGPTSLASLFGVLVLVKCRYVPGRGCVTVWASVGSA